MYPLRYLNTGHVLIAPEDNCDRVVDALLETSYGEDFCFALGFDPVFIGRLMASGFLVMSVEVGEGAPAEGQSPPGPGRERVFILLPKLHLSRSVLFFPDLHVKRSVKGLLKRYELRINTDFELIAGKCAAAYGDVWLTPPLLAALYKLRRARGARSRGGPAIPARAVSFGVYRDGELKAGEIGVTIGRAYTSYSGYHEENNAGTVQIILMARRLMESGYAFLDFGMPLKYKDDLGAQNISPSRFVEIFRAARTQAPAAPVKPPL